MDDGTEPIADDELLYRRIPVSTGYYSPITNEINSQAFAPHKTEDVTGISLYRENTNPLMRRPAVGTAGPHLSQCCERVSYEHWESELNLAQKTMIQGMLSYQILTRPPSETL
jgi:hypothetical protein